MAAEHIVIFLVTGLAVGFGAGLLGIGGAFFMTPVQYMVYISMGLPTDVAVKLAFGTTLLVILPTAIGGVWRHSKKRAVWWRAGITMGCVSIIGGFIGSALAVNMPGDVLKIAFGGVALLVSVRMAIAGTMQTEQKPVENRWAWIGSTLPVGLLTGLLGIGGGVVAIPIMVNILRFNMHVAVATSLAMMLFSSTGAIIGYILYGTSASGLPDYSIGYVYLPAWILLTVTSIVMTQVGALVAHKLPEKQLRYIFVALLFITGLKMVGLFEYLGLPL